MVVYDFGHKQPFFILRNNLEERVSISYERAWQLYEREQLLSESQLRLCERESQLHESRSLLIKI